MSLSTIEHNDSAKQRQLVYFPARVKVIELSAHGVRCICGRDTAKKLVASRVVPVIVFLVTLLSCVQPSSRERFINTPSEDGIYSFCLDFTDSLSGYDLYLYSRFDVDDSTLEKVGDIPVIVEFYSPILELSGEKIYFPLSRPVVNKLKRKEYVYLYRSGMRNFGPWIMTLKVEDGIVLPEGFCGFGVRWVRSK